jgi:protein-disulfide isomerase
MGLDWKQITTCVDDTKTHDEIVRRAKMGSDAGLQGTPTIFLNGRQLNAGQVLPVLQSAYTSAKSGN